ncbi:chorismate synthase, partial [bacterium]|nr:chorismate synthase [bacterium]
MASNSFGRFLRVTTFGESHGHGLGVVIDGLPAGLDVDVDAVQREMDRRRPGQSDITTPRNEADAIQVWSGLFEGRTTGTPLAIAFVNADQKSSAYEKLADVFRPGHADYT